MGRKGNWFSSVKKVLNPNSKAKKAKKANKLKNKPIEKENLSASDAPKPERVEVSHPHPLPPLEDVKLAEAENEQTKHAYFVAVASAAAAEAAVATTQAAAEVVQLTTLSRFVGKSMEEVAAIKIQTAFRGYLARRALCAHRGLLRLKSLVDGPTAVRQTANTLKSMQTLSRVQSQIQSRRLRMLKENQALQKQLLQKRMGEVWDDSLQSKEQDEANLLHKYEAALRRERALAYSYTHQQTWKRSARSTNSLFMDPTNPHWGWSWLERWMAARPWETQTSADKDLNSDRQSIKTVGGEITKSFARHQLNSDNPSSPVGQKPSSHHSPATPSSKLASSLATRKLKPPSPRGSVISQDEDSRSTFSIKSEQNRRHSIAGSSVRDGESLASSPSVPSYMAATQSAKAKLRLQSPLGMEDGNMPEKGSAGSAKKRLSFAPSPAKPRRHSGPPRPSVQPSVLPPSLPQQFALIG